MLYPGTGRSGQTKEPVHPALCPLPDTVQLALAPYATPLATSRATTDTLAKQAGTANSRLAFFTQWLVSVGLGLNLFLLNLPQATRNYILACYVCHLSMGNTLLCKQIRTATVKDYLTQAVKHFTTNGYPDPTTNIVGRRASIIQDILNESERWETMENRREPLTWDMVDTLRSNPASKSFFSLEAAMLDWLTVGMYAGFRLSEWAQADSDVNKKTSHGQPAWKLSRKHDSIAIIRSDVSISKDPDGAEYLKIRYRWQKNGQNGESILYGAASQGYPYRCPVTAMRNILRRADSLRLPPDAPLAWFLEGQHQQLITDKYICSILRKTASNTYKIIDDEALQRWSAHSIRVGACVLLHEKGAEPLFIKSQLRWKSDTFLTYLRHTPVLAKRHSALIQS